MSRARTLADLLDSVGDVKLENLDNTPEYTKPSSEPISYVSGLQTALDAKIDDTQVLTDVPLNAVFTDTIGSNNFLIDVDGDNLSRGQLLEEISADDGQNRFVVDNIVTSNTLAEITNGTEGQPGVADYATGVSPVSTGTQYFFSFPTAQYNEGNHESPQPHAYPLYFTSTNGRTTYQAFDTNGKKWGKQEMGTGCKITWSVIPNNIEVGEWEYGEDSPYSLTSSDWNTDIGFDPTEDIRWCLQEWGNISGLSFYEVPWTDARRTGTDDLDFAHINFFCTNLGSSVLGHVTDFPGSVTDDNLAVSMHKRTIDSGDIAIGTAFNWYSNSHANSYSGTVYNFRSVVLHELGHSFGMAHTNDTGTSMYPFAQSGETINGLADGDVQGIQTIYGLPLTGTQSTVFRTTKDNVAKDTMVVEHDFVSIGTTYDDTQLLVKGKMGVNTIFPQHAVDIVGTVRATSFEGDGSSLTGVDSLPTQTSQSGKFLTTDGSAASWSPPASDWTTIYDHSVDGDTTYIDFTTTVSAANLKGFDIRIRNLTPYSPSCRMYIYPLTSSGVVNITGGNRVSLVGLEAGTTYFYQSNNSSFVELANFQLTDTQSYGNSATGLTGHMQMAYDNASNPTKWSGTWTLGLMGANRKATVVTATFIPDGGNPNLTANTTLGGFRLSIGGSIIKSGFVEVRVIDAT